MQLVEHLLSHPDGSGELLIEAFEQQFGQGGGMEEPAPPEPTVEFENIKKYLLFGKLKELKTKLQYIGLNNKDENVQNILEFLDVLILFFHTFSYQDAQRFVDTLIQRSSELLNIAIPERVNFDAPQEEQPETPQPEAAPPPPNGQQQTQQG